VHPTNAVSPISKILAVAWNEIDVRDVILANALAEIIVTHVPKLIPTRVFVVS
jgi:hypothetical protein